MRCLLIVDDDEAAKATPMLVSQPDIATIGVVTGQPSDSELFRLKPRRMLNNTLITTVFV